MAVFDRTWYGRVLVERVEGFATKTQWKRAYKEIVDFERSLHAEGVTIVKFWLEISADEQLNRFNARSADPLKLWKLTDEDWRNRDRRGAYEHAISAMLRQTDHAAAPWTVIAAEDKPYARVAVLEALIDAVELGMLRAGQDPLAAEAAL